MPSSDSEEPCEPDEPTEGDAWRRRVLMAGVIVTAADVVVRIAEVIELFVW